jgi:predicted DNA-binding transcriptional regulator AlpA
MENVRREWLTYREAAELVGLSRTTLWEMVSAGEMVEKMPTLEELRGWFTTELAAEALGRSRQGSDRAAQLPLCAILHRDFREFAFSRHSGE